MAAWEKGEVAVRQLVALRRKVATVQHVVTYGSKSCLRLTSPSSPLADLRATIIKHSVQSTVSSRTVAKNLPVSLANIPVL